jgi:hypothetical protein
MRRQQFNEFGDAIVEPLQFLVVGNVALEVEFDAVEQELQLADDRVFHFLGVGQVGTHAFQSSSHEFDAFLAVVVAGRFDGESLLGELDG